MTSEMDPETQEMLKASLAADGLVAPIICIENEAGLVLVDGMHRLMDAIQANWPTIDVAVTEGDMATVLTRNLYLDHLRGKHKPSDMVKVIEALWKEFQLDSEKIAVKTGLKRDYIETLMLISELTPMCRQYLDDEKIKLGHAKALTRLKDPVQQETVLHQVNMYGLTVKATEDIVTEVINQVSAPGAPATVPSPAPPRQVKCAYCGDLVDLTLVASPVICMSLLRSLSSEHGAGQGRGAPTGRCRRDWSCRHWKSSAWLKEQRQGDMKFCRPACVQARIQTEADLRGKVFSLKRWNFSSARGGGYSTF